MIICTWKECKNEAKVPKIGIDGKQWANLCELHDKQLDEAIRPNNPSNCCKGTDEDVLNLHPVPLSYFFICRNCLKTVNEIFAKGDNNGNE